MSVDMADQPYMEKMIGLPEIATMPSVTSNATECIVRVDVPLPPLALNSAILSQKVKSDSATKRVDVYALRKYFIPRSSGTVLFVQRSSNDTVRLVRISSTSHDDNAKKNRVHQQFHL